MQNNYIMCVPKSYIYLELKMSVCVDADAAIRESPGISSRN